MLEESMTMVHSLSTIVLSLLEAEINLDPDFVENQPASDGNLGHSMFKENLHKAHGIPHNARCEDFIAAEIISNPLKNVHPTEFLSFDMATGEVLPSAIVTASHIFQARWKIKILTTFHPTVIHDPRNRLMLYKPVEHAFDRAQVCIKVFSKEGREDIYKFHLLDENLRNKSLTEHAKGLPGARENSCQIR